MSDLFLKLLNQNRPTVCGHCVNFTKKVDPIYESTMCTYYDRPTREDSDCYCREHTEKDDPHETTNIGSTLFNILFKLNESQEENRKLKSENEQLKKENKHLQCTIESNSQDDYIDYLEKQNERLKERIEELASNDKIVFMVNE